MRPLLSSLTALGISLAATVALAREPVSEALARPAISARHPERAVLLGAAMAGSRIVAVGERGLVIVSDDDGRTWRQAPAPVSVGLTAVRFVDERFGMAVGHGGAVLTTADAGNTWQLRLDGRRAAQIALAAARTRQDARAVQESERLVAEGPDKPFLDLLVLEDASVLVVGAYGLAFRSDDRGQSWRSWMDRLGEAEGLHLYAARKRGDVIVIAGEQGLVLRSDDAGRHFERIATPYNGSFFTVELPVDGEILLAGLRGNVWRSRDDGRNWEQIWSPVSASVTGSTLQSSGGVLLATQAGIALEQGRGDSLQAVNSVPLPALNHLLRVNERRLVALTDRGVLSLDLQALSKEGAP